MDGSNGHLNITLRVHKNISLLFFILGPMNKIANYYLKFNKSQS